MHKSSVSPDDLNADNADAYVDVLSVTDINTFIAEKELSEAKNKKEHQETLKKMEEMKELYDAALKERDIQSSEKDAALRKAALEIQSARNSEYLNEYQKQNEDYIEKKNIYIKKSQIKDWVNSVKIVFVHSLLVIVLFVINCFINIKKNEAVDNNLWIRIVIAIFNFIVFMIPFIRPLWNHERVSKAYKYLLCRSYRKQRNIEYENEYRGNNLEPILKQMSIEEILEELKNNK